MRPEVKGDFVRNFNSYKWKGMDVSDAFIRFSTRTIRNWEERNPVKSRQKDRYGKEKRDECKGKGREEEEENHEWQGKGKGK